jgi:hypothetical protein
MENLEKQLSLIDKMYQISEKFSDIAMDKCSTKQARDAFFVAEKALRLAIDLETLHRVDRPKDIEHNLYLIFLSTITTPIARSDVWRNYLEFCDKYSIDVLQKSVLYAALASYNFFMYRDSSGNWMVRPPNVPSKSLIDAKNSWHLIEMD